MEDKDWYEACIKQLEEQNNRLIDTLKEKDKEINSLIVDYEKRISQEQELMSNMEHRLTEKQNTIDEINKEFVQSVKDWKTLCAEKDKEISKLQASYQQVKTQLAIQELEKAKASADKWFDYWENSKYEGNRYDKLDVSNAYLQMSCEIEEQIKKLRGENEEV